MAVHGHRSTTIEMKNTSKYQHIWAHIYIYIPAPSNGSPMEAPTLLRDLHWTPFEGPYIYIYMCIHGLIFCSGMETVIWKQKRAKPVCGGI